jgi:hypothetical protein
MDEYDADEGAAYINEIMAEDEAKDPYLKIALYAEGVEPDSPG